MLGAPDVALGVGHQGKDTPGAVANSGDILQRAVRIIRIARLPVAMLVGSIADGMTIEEVAKEYPQITTEAVRAALAYAADVVRQEILLPLAG